MLYRKGDAVTYVCGETPQPATVAEDVIAGDLDAWILLAGERMLVPIDCIQ